MTYIDADKLKAEIERYIKHYEKFNRDEFKNGELYICQELLSFIKSLQQEQPESICPRCVYLNKMDDICEYPYGGRTCRINENGVYECNGFEEVEQQDQPEVDLKNEIITQWSKCNPTDEGMGSEYAIIAVEQFASIARHFYELGLKAKER